MQGGLSRGHPPPRDCTNSCPHHQTADRVWVYPIHSPTEGMNGLIELDVKTRTWLDMLWTYEWCVMAEEEEEEEDSDFIIRDRHCCPLRWHE